MLRRRSALTGLLLVLLSSFFLAGCAGRSRCCRSACRPARCAPGPCGPARMARMPAARESALYRGSDGSETTLAEAAADWGEVDVVAFGELHGDLVGAKAQLELLKRLAAQKRPLALAMEFFERDTQADLDAYLAGTLEKDAFLEQTRRNRDYAATHGPLVDFCKENGIPVIAANAPRKLVTAYRKSGEDYETWLASLSEEERGYLPEETDELEDEYRKRFMDLMGERGAAFFKSQSLWDDAMAEAMTDFRAEHPNHRILFIVGGFHVQEGLGTITKYRNRRGRHEVRILSMERSKQAHLPFDPDLLGTADLILLVPAPKPQAASPHKKRPKGASPHKKAPARPGGTS